MGAAARPRRSRIAAYLAQFTDEDQGPESLPRAAPIEARPPAGATPTTKVFDPEGGDYDYASAIAAGLEPDATGHWPSRVPATGLLLKGRKHPTWAKTEEGEAAAGMAIQKGPGGRYYSQPTDLQERRRARSRVGEYLTQFETEPTAEAPVDVSAALGREAERRLAEAAVPAEATSAPLVPQAHPSRRAPRAGAPPLTTAEELAVLGKAGQDVAVQAFTGPAKGVLRVGAAAAGLVGAEETARKLRERRELIARAHEPETPFGTATDVAGQLAPEFLPYVVGEGLLALAGRAAEVPAVVGRLPALARRVAALARPATRAGRIARTVASGAPIDVALAAGGEPEESLTGFAGELTDSKFLQQLAKTRTGRAIGDLLSGAALGVTVGAAAEGAARLGERRARPRLAGEDALGRLRRKVAGAIAGEDIEALKRQATVDPKTGALNARADAAATARALTERAEGQRIVRFRLDMDNFKALNDARGHAAGDEALQAVKDALEAATRSEDLVSLSRLGGDEFGLTMNIAEGADPAAIRDRLEAGVNAELAKHGLDVAGERRVGASIGFAEAIDEATAANLDELADAAARTRKTERAVSQPRAAAPAAGVAPTPPGAATPPGRQPGARSQLVAARRQIQQARAQGEAALAETRQQLQASHAEGRFSEAQYRQLEAELQGRPLRHAKLSDEDLERRLFEVMDRAQESSVILGDEVHPWTRFDDDVVATRSGTAITSRGGRGIGRLKDDGRIIDEILAEMEARGVDQEAVLDRYMERRGIVSEQETVGATAVGEVPFLAPRGIARSRDELLVRAVRERLAARAGTAAPPALSPLQPGYVEERLASDLLPDVRHPTAAPAVGTPVLTAPQRAAVLQELQEALHLPIRVGKLRAPQRVLGLFKVRPEVVRLRVANDVQAASHEIGHALHKLFFGTTEAGALSRAVLRPWKDELLPLAKGISTETVAEGWAEFWHRWLTHPEAAERAAPRVWAYVNERLARDYPEILEHLGKARQLYDAWLKAGPDARVAAHISTQDAPRHWSIRDIWQRFRTDVIDDLAPVERAVQDLTRGAGPKDLMEDAVQLARLTRGAAGTAEHFLERGTLDFGTFALKGKSLREVLAPVGEQLDEFRKYAVARRAHELMARGKETGLQAADVAYVLGKHQRNALFQEAFAGLQRYNRDLLEFLRDAGVLSSDAFEAITRLNREYVPFYRVVEDAPGRAGGGSRFGHLFNPVKRLAGSGREIIDPLESIVKNTYLYTRLAWRQQVSQALARLAERHGVGAWLERIPEALRPVRLSRKEMVDDLIRRLDVSDPDAATTLRDLFDAQPEVLEEVAMFFKPGDYFKEPNVISVLEGGKRAWYQVHPELYQALEGLGHEQINTLLRVLSFPARTLRAGATLALEFVARNPLRDAVQAFVTSEYGFLPGIDTARGVFHALKRDDLYWKWRASGADRATLVGLDRKELRRTVDQLVKRRARITALLNPLEALRAASEAMETATRLGEFAVATQPRSRVGRFVRETLLRGQAPEAAGKAGWLRATAASREVSVDFARHGAKTQVLRHLAAFWNARFQGYDRLVRTFRQHPLRASARAVAGITLPSIALYLLNRDEEGWDDIPRWHKNIFWLTRVGETWHRIPKPFELGVVFGTIPERILEWIDQQDPGALERVFSETLASDVADLIPVPTAVEPLIENYANYSLFLDRPIVPRGLEEVSPEYQATDRTSDVARGLGRMLNYSPAKIDNLIRGYGAGLTQTAVDVLDVALPDAAERGERPARPLAERLPGVRGFVVPELSSSESEERFYEVWERVRRAKRDYDFQVREGNEREAERIAEGRGGELEAYGGLQDVAASLTELRKAQRAVSRDPELSAEQKRAELVRIRRAMAAMAAEAVTAMTR